MTHNPVFAIMDRAQALAASGADVISLAVGEPDAPTAEFVVAAAVRAARDPRNHHYGQAAGLRGLRETVAGRLARQTGLGWPADDVHITLGAKHALFLALHAVIGAGEAVIVTKPGWPGHRAAVEATNGQVRYAATDAADGHRVTASALDAARAPDVRAVIIANPGNPTGTAYGAGAWAEIAAWAARRDVWLITDDVYSSFVYDKPYVPALRAAPQLQERCIIIDSVSKAYGMTGWRVGWLAGPASVVDAATKMTASTVTHRSWCCITDSVMHHQSKLTRPFRARRIAHRHAGGKGRADGHVACDPRHP